MRRALVVVAAGMIAASGWGASPAAGVTDPHHGEYAPRGFFETICDYAPALCGA